MKIFGIEIGKSEYTEIPNPTNGYPGTVGEAIVAEKPSYGKTDRKLKLEGILKEAERGEFTGLTSSR